VLFLFVSERRELMRQRIVLCDSDSDYSLGIASFIRESEFRKEVELTVCSHPDSLRDWMKRERFDVLVIGAEFAGDFESGGLLSEGLVWISDGEEGIGAYGAPLLSKYDAVPRLLRTWLRYSRKPIIGNRKDRGASPIVGIWSAGGGVGKTRLASALSQVWVEQGLDTFVIGLDPGIYESANAYTCAFHDVSEWLYGIKSGMDHVNWLGKAPASSRLHYFLPDSPYREFIGLGRGDGGELLTVAATAFGCDCVLVDLGDRWSPFTEEVWSRSDVLLCISTEEELCLRKTDKWLQEWSAWSEQPAFREKTVFVLNKSLGHKPALATEWVQQAFRLPYVPEWKQSTDRMDPLFQERIHALAEELWTRCRRTQH
jgi:cellulose biosynthesis protein BcsQ